MPEFGDNNYDNQQQSEGGGFFDSFLWKAVKIVALVTAATVTFGAILKHNDATRNTLNDLTKDKDGKGGWGDAGAELYDKGPGKIENKIKEYLQQPATPSVPTSVPTNASAKESEKRKIDSLENLATIGASAGAAIVTTKAIKPAAKAGWQAVRHPIDNLDYAAITTEEIGKKPINSLSSLDNIKTKALSLPGIKQAAGSVSALSETPIVAKVSQFLNPIGKPFMRLFGVAGGTIVASESISNANELHTKGETGSAWMEGVSGVAEGAGLAVMNLPGLLIGTAVKDYTYLASVIATDNKTGVTRSTITSAIGEGLGVDKAVGKIADWAYDIKRPEELAKERGERDKLAAEIESKLPEHKQNILNAWKDQIKELKIENIEPLALINHVESRGWDMPTPVNNQTESSATSPTANTTLAEESNNKEREAKREKLNREMSHGSGDGFIPVTHNDMPANTPTPANIQKNIKKHGVSGTW